MNVLKITELFIDTGYSASVTEVLNNIQVYMKVILLRDMSTECGTKMDQWGLQAKPKQI